LRRAAFLIGTPKVDIALFLRRKSRPALGTGAGHFKLAFGARALLDNGSQELPESRLRLF